MFFYVQGPNKHDLMPLETIINRREVKRTAAIKKTDAVDAEQIQQPRQKHQRSHAANDVYQAIEQLPEDNAALFACQIMTTPVMTLMSSTTIDHALKLFQKKRFRHLPVVSSNEKVIGMISDRDVLQYIAGVQEGDQINTRQHTRSARVELLMNSPVITASERTDVRYIARVFVERRVGAMPIVLDGELRGMVTRSDILHAVMSHYGIQLWI